MIDQAQNAVLMRDTVSLADAAITIDPAVDETAWPVENIVTTIRSEAAKFTSGTEIRIVFDEEQHITAIGLVDLVVSDVDTEITVKAYDEAGVEQFSYQFDSGLPLQIWGEGYYSAGIWGGYLNDPDMPRAEIFDTDGVVYKHWSVTVDTDQPWRLGRLLLSRHLQPEDNFEYEFAAYPADESRTMDSRGGTPHTDIGARRETVEFEFHHLRPHEAMGPFWDLAAAGRREDMILILTPKNPTIMPKTTIYGRFADEITLSSPRHDGWASGRLTFKESR